MPDVLLIADPRDEEALATLVAALRDRRLEPTRADDAASACAVRLWTPRSVAADSGLRRARLVRLSGHPLIQARTEPAEVPPPFDQLAPIDLYARSAARRPPFAEVVDAVEELVADAALRSRPEAPEPAPVEVNPAELKRIALEHVGVGLAIGALSASGLAFDSTLADLARSMVYFVPVAIVAALFRLPTWGPALGIARVLRWTLVASFLGYGTVAGVAMLIAAAS